MFAFAAVPMFVVPGVDIPLWASAVFGVAALTGLVVLIYQAVRYFRDDGDDRDDPQR